MHDSLYSASDALAKVANAQAQQPAPAMLTGNSTDTVFIKGLKVDAVIGVYEWEQQIKQPLIYDIEMVGKIEVEIEILSDGSISTTMWVVYPDGFGEEVFSVQEAEQKLEL